MKTQVCGNLLEKWEERVEGVWRPRPVWEASDIRKGLDSWEVKGVVLCRGWAALWVQNKEEESPQSPWQEASTTLGPDGQGKEWGPVLLGCEEAPSRSWGCDGPHPSTSLLCKPRLLFLSKGSQWIPYSASEVNPDNMIILQHGAAGRGLVLGPRWDTQTVGGQIPYIKWCSICMVSMPNPHILWLPLVYFLIPN